MRVHLGIQPRIRIQIFERYGTGERYLGIAAMPVGSGEQRANYNVCASSRGLR